PGRHRPDGGGGAPHGGFDDRRGVPAGPDVRRGGRRLNPAPAPAEAIRPAADQPPEPKPPWPDGPCRPDDGFDWSKLGADGSGPTRSEEQAVVPRPRMAATRRRRKRFMIVPGLCWS